MYYFTDLGSEGVLEVINGQLVKANIKHSEMICTS